MTGHTRPGLLASNTKAWCTEHGLQLIIDYFHRVDGSVLALACGCRRREAL